MSISESQRVCETKMQIQILKSPEFIVGICFGQSVSFGVKLSNPQLCG